MPTERDPTKFVRQLNTNVPFEFLEFLRLKSEKESISLNRLVNDALEKAYGKQYRSNPYLLTTPQSEISS